MSQNICNICGANYEYHNGRWKCPACGAYKAEELSNEEITLLYHAAQKLRLSDFDEAEKAYADIIEKFPRNPNGYWGRLLSKYGIKYEEDFDGRKIPTCYATSIESVITDKDYLKAIELSDQETKAYYTLQAEYIERVRKEWVEKARKEKPYDIFICYKDSDLANGIDRTQDSIAAQELYIHLRDQGYRVFFSRESLRGKVGEKYEPYIFNALSTAKVMLVYGSKSEYITSTWLKNEWTRYEKRLQAGEKKPNSLIVACDGFSPTELPKVLSSMQCFDATSRSFYTDLDAVLKKIIKGEEKPKPVVEPKPEKKKSKKLPIAIASIAALIAIFLCILLPNVLGDKPFATVTDSKYGVVISADSEIFDKNTSVIVDKLTDGAQYTSLVSVVNTSKTIDIQNAIIYDIECDVDITKSVTIKVAYTKSDADSTVKVYYVSDDKTTIEEHSCIYDDGYVQFKTTHLSYYVIGEGAKATTPGGNENPGGDDPNPPATPSLTYEDGVLQVGVCADVPMYEYIENGEYKGIEIDILKAIANKLGLEIRFENDVFEDLLGNLNNKEVDCIIGVVETAERNKYATASSVMFADEYGEFVIYLNKDANTLTQEINNAISELKSDGTIQSIVSSYAEVTPEFVFAEVSGGYELSKYNGQQKTVFVPSTYNDKDVIYIASNAFLNNTDIEEVILPSTIQRINESAFKGCTSLKKINLNNVPIETIGNNAFYGCNSLDYVIISNGVLQVGNDAFYGCDTLKVYYGGSKSDWKSISNNSISDEQVYYYSSNKPTEQGNWWYRDEGTTLPKIWNINWITITYDANGGVGETPSETFDSSYVETAFSAFTREGYEFIGWSLTAGETVDYIEGVSCDIKSSTTLYAVWRATETKIEFNANGGNGSISPIISSTGETVTLTKNTFTRDGYAFIGWATSTTGSVVYQDEATYTAGAEAKYTLYAVWSANTNALVLKANDGTTNERTVNIKTGETQKIPANTFTRAGYTFMGWSSTSNGSVEYTDQANFTMDSSSQTLYAVWAENENSVVFNANGGSGSMNPQTIKTNATANLNACTFTRNGYIFAGWATSASGSVVYPDNAAYTMGTNAQYTLYAVWTVSDYKITYELNGGSNNLSNPVGYNVNSNTITLQNPTRTGYTFDGWYSDASFRTECNSIPSGSTGAKTFYASWTPNQNTIKFNSNGGSGSMSNVTVATDTTTTLPQNAFTRTGYEFAGWSTVANGSVAYADKASYTMGTNSSYTLYAVWNVVNYTITYNTDGGSISGHKTSYNINTSTFTLPTPEKEDYIFLGWSGTGIAGVQKTVSVAKGSTGNRTYTANWELNAYTITLDANGGSVSTSEATVQYGKNFTLPIPKRPGYIFLGWYGGTANNANAYTDGGGSSLTAWNKTAGATFYAHWQVDFSEGLDYKLIEGWLNAKHVYAYEVSGIGSCTDTIIKLPSEIDGIPVIGIGESAFSGNKNITSVIFPTELFEGEEGVRELFAQNSGFGYDGLYIKNGAFSNCSNLESIVLGKVSGISGHAFYNCAKLNSVTIDAECPLKLIGGYAFGDCSLLQSIIIPSECTTISSYAFNKCTDLVVYCEIDSKPEGWDDGWNMTSVHEEDGWHNSYCTVYWGFLRDGYKVEFNYDGATGNNSVTYRFVEIGNSYILPIPTKTGYTFDGWYYGTTQVTNKNGVTLNAWSLDFNCTLKAKWTANTNTAYTVKHYLENANDSGYTLQDTETLYGTTGDTVTPNTKTYTGFNTPSKTTVTIAGDGKAVLEYHYTRTTKTVTFVTNGGTAIADMSVKYQQTPVLPDATRAGFTFSGWFTDVVLADQFALTSIDSNITVYAWWTEENKPSDFRYYGSSEITISGYEGSSSAMNIPTYIAGVPVTSIANHAFQFCNTITNVVMSKNISVIGDNAFYGCDSLVSVVIPNSVLTIGSGAFCDCDVLAIIEIPDSVTSIGDWAFGGCVSLTSVSIGNGVQEIGADAFNGCISLKSIEIPTGIKKIEKETFYGSGLTNITIPSNVEIVGEAGFAMCKNLERVDIGNGVSEIQPSAFAWCDSLTSFTMGSSISTIERAFHDISDISIYVPSLEDWLQITWLPEDTYPFGIDYDLYVDNVLVEHLVIPESITTINKFAFSNCKSLKTIEFHGKELTIQGSAFANCDSIESVTIPSTVTKLEISAFSDCDNLKEVIVDCNYIGSYCFYGCESLTKITIHKNVATIGDYILTASVNAVIYCDVASKPDGWSENWNKDSNGSTYREVVWFYIGDTWDGTTTYSFAGGTGAQNDPYLIATAEQLAFVATSVNQGVDTFKGKHLKLTTNIHLMGIEWTPIGTNYSFEGIFDGGGYTIYGLKVTDTTLRYSGLFGCSYDAKFFNVVLKEAYVNNATGYSAGLLVGHASSLNSSSLIENCVAEGSVILYKGGMVGGIVGDIYGNVSKSYANITVYGSAYDENSSSWSYVYVGGIAGSAHRIENCWSNGTITAVGGDLYRDVSYAGGIAGMAEYIGNSYSTADVSSNAKNYSYAGGIVGKSLYSTIVVENSFAAGNITGSSYSYHDVTCGRIIAEDDDGVSINNCYADSSQSIDYNSNTYGTLQFTQTLQSENFIYNTLGWNSDIWQINAGGFPTLK